MAKNSQKNTACPQCLQHSCCRRGFTIIETMIVMIGMGSLLNANLIHQKSRDMRSIMDNLSFIMEDMSRNLRTGSSYHCISESTSSIDPVYLSKPVSGTDCWGIAFKQQDEPVAGNRWVYSISENQSDANKYSVFKSEISKQSGSDIQLTPDEVSIDFISSGFAVLGAESKADGNSQQPFVTIRLVGSINFKGIETPFSLQTSVSQRALDI